LHLLLVDQMTCPRCGPEFGLILLANEMEERKVMDGYLGCSNCRNQFPVANGMADLRSPFDLVPKQNFIGFSDRMPTVTEVGALLDLTDGSGNVGLIGNLSNNIRDLSQEMSNFQFVGIHREMDHADSSLGADKGSRIICGSKLPFRSECFRGVVVSGKDSEECMMELVRTLAVGGRIAIWENVDEPSELLRNEGFDILMKQSDVAVLGRNRSISGNSN